MRRRSKWALLFWVIVTETAAAQVPVPSECVELAQREGFPTDVLTKAQAAKAKYRMSRLSDRDPLVKQCREAVKAAQKANDSR